MAAKFASTDREAFRALNNAAHDARRITGRDHPEALGALDRAGGLEGNAS